MRQLGIATKLYLAFGSLFLLAVVAASIGWQGFQRVSDSQNSVIDQAIPGLRQAHQLSALNASIGAASQQLLRTSTENDRLKISAQLFSEVQQVNLLIDDFKQKGFAASVLVALRSTVSELEDSLHRQDDLVQRRIHQQTRFRQLEVGLIDTTVALNHLADSLVANAAATTTAVTSNLYDLVEDDAKDQRLYEIFDRLVEVDLDAMERMYELRLRSANLNGLFSQVAKATNIDQLNRLRQRATETISILKRRISEINDPQRRQTAEELLLAMELNNGPLYMYGIFEARISLIQISDSLTQLSVQAGEASQSLNGIVNDLNTTGGTLINRVSTAAKESLDNSRLLFSGISIALLLAAAAIFWWFIKRNVVRRLISLRNATQSITDGDYNVAIGTEGHDELTDMGKALRGFRDNAIENRQLDAELREHKAHLEELVEKRSQQLRQANDRLSEEVQDHALARDKAEQASEAKTAFLATMSHELRTPLSGALGTLKLLAETELTSDQLEYIKLTNAANLSLLEIVNDILGYSQLEAGRMKLESKVFDLLELLHNVTGLMKVSVHEKGNQLVLKAPELAKLWLRGDSGKLQQILINLIGNANKFTDQGLITLQVDWQSDLTTKATDLQFLVCDNGIGIAADKQTEIFQAFTQVDASSARHHGGIGLGLAICERLVKALGGQMTLNSELDVGTTIGFKATLKASDESALFEPTGLPLHELIAPMTVLMVEDDETNRLVTQHYLEHLGHQVLSAQTGEQALEILDQGGMSLVLLDISLPGIDGLTILKRIRNHADSKIVDLPVIAMSAHVFNEEIDHYLGAGMNGFLGKPFSLVDLQTSIAEVLIPGSPIAYTSASNTFPKLRLPKHGIIDQEMIIEVSSIEDDINRLGLQKVKKLVALFCQSASQLKPRLLDALVQSDFQTIEKLSHQLNGSAGNFGLQKLSALMVKIESSASAQENQLDATYGATLETTFEQSINALNAYLSNRQLSNQQDPLSSPQIRKV